MSYCRFSEGDVYAYECAGGVQFWTPDDALNRLCSTYNEAYQYAKILRSEHGLRMPDHAIEALRFGALDEIERFTGPDSAVSEMIAENAKLREQTENLISLLRKDWQIEASWDGLRRFWYIGWTDEHVAQCEALAGDAS